MKQERKKITQLVSVSISAALLCGGVAVPAPHNDTPCTRTPAVEQSCSNLLWIEAIQGKPFVAERVSSSAKSEPNKDIVARDTAGRIHEESQLWSSGGLNLSGGVRAISALGGTPSSQRESGGTFATESSAVAQGHGELRISILDCFGGKKIELSPSKKTAVIQQSCSDVPPFHASREPYSYKLTRTLFDDPQPDRLVEDLGWKQFPMGRARGVKITWLGHENDGDFNGKPTKAWEEWMSDDLGVTVLWVYSDFKKHLESRVTLQNLRRQPPDASLFEVPPEYEVTDSEQHQNSSTQGNCKQDC